MTYYIYKYIVYEMNIPVMHTINRYNYISIISLSESNCKPFKENLTDNYY